MKIPIETNPVKLKTDGANWQDTNVIKSAEERALSALNFANSELGNREVGYMEAAGKNELNKSFEAGPHKISHKILQDEDLGKVSEEKSQVNGMKAERAGNIPSDEKISSQEAFEALLKIDHVKKSRPELYW
jgi:hypothetical protein